MQNRFANVRRVGYHPWGDDIWTRIITCSAKKMQSKTSSIAVASLFVAGVIGWYAARYWAFDQFRPFSLIAVVLAIALATSFLRGDVSSRWLTLAFSSFGAYSSFNLFLHIRSKAALVEGREIAGEAFILPGVLFSLSSVLLVVSYLAGQFRKRMVAE